MLKGNRKKSFGNLLSPLGAQNKASQMLRVENKERRRQFNKTHRLLQA